MTFQQFAEANRARCTSPNGFNHSLHSWTLSDWMVAAMGELGEAANIVKKLNRYRDDIPGNTVSEADLYKGLSKEIADAVIYLDLLAQSQGLRLEDIIRDKFNETSTKLGFPYWIEAEEVSDGEDRAGVRGSHPSS